MEICPFCYATHDTNNPVLMDFTNNSKKIIIIRIVIRTLETMVSPDLNRSQKQRFVISEMLHTVWHEQTYYHEILNNHSVLPIQHLVFEMIKCTC